MEIPSTVSRTIDSGAKTQQSSSRLCPQTLSTMKGYDYRWFYGHPIPFVRYQDRVGEGAFPLFGYQNLRFLSTKYCTNCQAILTGPDDMCGDCRESPLFRRLRCILDGPGVPFGKQCTGDNPACDLQPWADAICYTDWMLYVVSVFGLVKVGISRREKGNCSVGFTQRIISQGAGEWIAFGPLRDMETAQRTEDELSNDLSLTQRVTSAEKWNYINYGKEDVPLPREEVLRWTENQGIPLYMEGSFAEYFTSMPDNPYPVFGTVKDGVQGSLCWSRGSIAVFEHNGNRTAYDLAELAGLSTVGGL
ncbi:MAG: DUF2797 domain-containing protein [Candidatus Lokiarchaeota archaeon]|nr:DUF2797 domain-containing protein [Candidatus Lokiarchaeota archaeon]